MSQSTLNKIWSFLSVLLLYLCLNVWSITQQWQLSFPGNPFKTESVTPYGATIYGVPICGMLLVLVSIVTRIYALRSPKTRWESRFPRFGDFELNIAQGDAKAFQIIMLFLFLLLPTAGVIHFQSTFLSGTVCGVPKNCKPDTAVPCTCRVRISGWHAMLFESPAVPPGIVLKYDPNMAKDVGPEFIQLWQPWTYLFIALVSVCAVIWCAVAVFQPELHRVRRNQKDASSHQNRIGTGVTWISDFWRSTARLVSLKFLHLIEMTRRPLRSVPGATVKMA